MTDYKEILAPFLQPPGDFPACFAFSVHKSGSTLMNKMIVQACNRDRIPSISIPDRLFKAGVFEATWEMDSQLPHLFVPGRIYCGFRKLPEFMRANSFNLKAQRSVLLIRDPRDALVSQYFSFGGKHVSHKLPEKNTEQFLAQAQRTAHMDIDDYVVHAAPGLFKKLTTYRNELDFSQTRLFRYEEIYFDKRSFLEHIFEHFSVPISARTLDIVAKANDVRPEKEDPTQHVRQGAPGDHRAKLKPETIDQLNQVFAPLAGWSGYAP